MPRFLSLSQVFNRKPGWYRGDFHAHTDHSDGVHPPAELAEVAKAAGLDFFTITDHNRISAYPGFGEEPGILILPGIEVTLKNGHFNVFGLDRDLDWIPDICGGGLSLPRLPGQYQTSSDLMQQMAAQGLLNSINHPLLRPWAWEEGATDLRNLHCLEIWNDPSWPDNARDNPRAVQLWTDLLNAGYRITGIGGSDYHRPAPKAGESKPPERLGLPSTYVYAEELSGNAILAGLRRQRAYVSLGPRATFQARTDGRTYDIGDDLGQLNGKIQLLASVEDCPVEAHAMIVKNGSVLDETDFDQPTLIMMSEDKIAPEQSAWYRFEVQDENGLRLAITNPIFAGPRRAPDRFIFGDFAGKYGIGK